MFTSHSNSKQINLPFHVGSFTFMEELNENEHVKQYFSFYHVKPIIHVVGLVPENVTDKLVAFLEDDITLIDNLLGEPINNLILKPKLNNSSHLKNDWDNLIKKWQTESYHAFETQKLNDEILLPFTKVDLQKTLLQRSYNTVDAKKFSVLLGKHYDMSTESSNMLFNEGTNPETKKAALIHVLKQLKGDWYLKEEIVLGKISTFYMSDSLKTAVIANTRIKK